MAGWKKILTTDTFTQVTGVTIATTGWSLNGSIYEYSISNANITSTSIVDVIPDNADLSVAQTAAIYPRTESSSGSVKIFADAVPTATIGCTLNIIETA
jgi:hypothetical protein